MKYPIAEIFHSVQGEGHWMGLPMTFVRLAGCSVGKYHFGPDQPATCPAYGGDFQCDTDYRLKFKLEGQEVIHALAPGHTMCITGGEPADHDLSELIQLAHRSQHRVHIETSL